MKSNPRLLVVSPHLDDAVLSCGLLLAAHPDSTVCTVFTAPPARDMTTDWDRASGFAGAFEAMRARREEDLEALGLLDARAVHLPFCDAQYEVPAAPEQLAAALEQTIERVEPTHLLIPLGLFHSDHLLVSDLCLPLLARAPAFDMLAYEDVPYRRMPGSVQTRLCELARRGLLAQAPCALDSAATPQRERSKHAALVSYRSQFRAFGPGGHADLFSPERYWQLGVDANMAEAPTRGTSLAEPTLPVR